MKYIKTILLIAGLIASLSSVSYATKKQNNENNEILTIDEKTKISIDLKELKNHDKDIKLLEYYQNVWDLESEKNKREDILNKLNKLEEIIQSLGIKKIKKNNSFFGQSKMKMNVLFKNMSISNLNFNLLQSILLDYYNFSISFSKYNILVVLLFNNESIKQTEQYISFMEKYNKFLNSIRAKSQELVNLLCKNFFLTNPQDPKNFQKDNQIASTNINADNSNNDKILNETSKTILNLESNFQEIFNISKIAIPQQKLWYKTFKENNTNLDDIINEKTDISALDIMPKQDETNKDATLDKFELTKIPPHYKLNLYILGAVVKMELIKSLSYLKDLKQYHSLSSSQNEEIPQYNSLKKYVNKLYRFYNNLRCFIVYCKKTNRRANYQKPRKNKAHNIKVLNELILKVSEDKSDEKDYKDAIKRYIKDQTMYNDILSSSAHPFQFMAQNVCSPNFFKSYYNNKQEVYNTNNLYNNIEQNKAIYDNLMYDSNTDKMAPIKALDKFFINLDNTKSNKFFKEFNYAISNKNNDENLKPFENIEYIPLNLTKNIRDKDPNKISTAKENLGKNIKILQYYQNVWNSKLETSRRNNILNKLERLNNIFGNWSNNKNLIYKNISSSNFDFNMFQSILLDYYNFSISFNKYNILISLLDKINFEQLSKIYNTYDEYKPLKESYDVFSKLYTSFMNNYKEFISNLQKNINLINSICQDFFTNYSEDPKIYQQNAQNNLTIPHYDILRYDITNQVLNETKDTILNLESNFQELFKILNINTIETTEWNELFNQYSNSPDSIDKIINATISKIMPQQNTTTTNYELQKILPHYKLNLHILGTVIKMELIKSLKHLKKLNPDFTTLSEKNQYAKLKQYANKLYRFYISLKAFLVYCEKNSSNQYPNYYDYSKNKTKDKVTLQEEQKKLRIKKENYNKIFKDYISNQNNLKDLLVFSTINTNYLYKLFTSGFKNDFQTYYLYRHNVTNLPTLYDHINNNIIEYNNLVNYDDSDKIAPIKAFDRFFINLDNPENRYFDKFYNAINAKQNINDYLETFKDIMSNKTNIDKISLFNFTHNDFQQNQNFPITKNINTFDYYNQFINNRQNNVAASNLSEQLLLNQYNMNKANNNPNFYFSNIFDSLNNNMYFNNLRNDNYLNQFEINTDNAPLSRQNQNYSNNQNIIYQLNSMKSLVPPILNQSNNTHTASNEIFTPTNMIFNINQINLFNNNPNQQNPTIKNQSNTPSSNKSDNNILGNKTKRNKK